MPNWRFSQGRLRGFSGRDIDVACHNAFMSAKATVKAKDILTSIDNVARKIRDLGGD